jgi:hypothetical protein
MKNPSNPNATATDDPSGSEPRKGPIKDMQALIKSGANLVPFRELTVCPCLSYSGMWWH